MWRHPGLQCVQPPRAQVSARGTAWRGVVHNGALTPLQKRIAAMQAMGRTIREVANALAMKPDAVKRHVEKIHDWRALEAMRRAREDA